MNAVTTRRAGAWIGRILLTAFTIHVAAGPAADTATALRRFFEGLDAGAPAAIVGRALQNPQQLAAFYQGREHVPLWVDGGPLAGERAALLAQIDTVAEHGLVPAAYHRDVIQHGLTEPGAVPEHALELLLSDAFLSQVRHRTVGAVNPVRVDPEWGLLPPEVDAPDLLRRTAAGEGSVHDVLQRLWPDHAEYRSLLEARARILASGEIRATPVFQGALLKPGQSSPRVALLKDRLLGPDEHTNDYDEPLRRAVVAFQNGAGLEPDGLVGDATLEVLNATTFSWIDRLDANLERWRWLPRSVPDTYVRVNIAAFTLRAIRHDQDDLIMPVIVGRPYRRTPVFAETIKYMVFNPFWNVPYKLATQDKLPELKRDPSKLAALGYEVRPEDGDRFVPVDAFDWQTVTAGSFRHLLRQKPGPANALGRIKFMLPNPYSVYLHDTPNTELFARIERVFSSGCVRLGQPLALARWLFEVDKLPGADRIDDLATSGNTQTVYLKNPVPAYIVYLTAFTDNDRVLFRRDVYQRDSAIVAYLRAPSAAESDGTSP